MTIVPIQRWLLACAVAGGLLVSAALRPAGADEAAPTSDSSLRVITYNVQFLPGVAAIANKRKEPKYRAETLGQKLAAYDVVGLNEVFELPMRKLLLAQLEEAWGDDYHVVVAPKPDDGRVDGGLAIATRLPVLASHSTVYSQSSSVEKYGVFADGFAAKGALHARIARHPGAGPGDVIDVFVTHLESKEQAVRDVQYRELAEFVRQHSDPQHAALMMGDFNTRGNPEYRNDPQSSYQDLITALRGARPDGRLLDLWVEIGQGPEGTSDQERDHGGRRIDYIFVLEPLGGGASPKPKSIRVNRFLDERVGALSDHSAVEADFDWPQAP